MVTDLGSHMLLLSQKKKKLITKGMLLINFSYTKWHISGNPAYQVIIMC